MADLTESLRGVPLFASVESRDLDRLAKRMSKRTFKSGDVVTEEGGSGVGFFVIEDGSATVRIRGEEVRTLSAGDHFGEIALIDEGTRSATITAETDLHCHGIAAWEFRAFVQEHPEVAWPLLTNLASRLREAEARSA